MGKTFSADGAMEGAGGEFPYHSTCYKIPILPLSLTEIGGFIENIV